MASGIADQPSLFEKEYRDDDLRQFADDIMNADRVPSESLLQILPKMGVISRGTLHALWMRAKSRKQVEWDNFEFRSFRTWSMRFLDEQRGYFRSLILFYFEHRADAPDGAVSQTARHKVLYGPLPFTK